MSKGSEVVGLRDVDATDRVAEEAAHLAGYAILTAGVAALLVAVAIPASIGLGIAATIRSFRKRG
jgi:hypothetical protein